MWAWLAKIILLQSISTKRYLHSVLLAINVNLYDIQYGNIQIKTDE